MLSYNDLYEHLRKEKYNDQLQQLPRNFVPEFSDFMTETRKKFSDSDVSSNGFSDDFLKEKKQYENAMALFKELILRRKKKILNLVFIAAETGIMKKDFVDMLPFEQDLFERLVRAVDDADKSLRDLMNGKPLESVNKRVIIKEDIEQFVDMGGEVIGPFKKGNLIDIDSQIADILVSDGKAMVVDADK